MSWVLAEDVIASWIGADAPDNPALVQTWIDRAEREVRFRVPDIQARIDAEQPPGELRERTRDVVIAMVLRTLRNPEGVRKITIVTGPFRETRTYPEGVPLGLVPSSDELAKLTGTGVSA
ncbi:hypothetical protein D9V34_07140 [Mycetocola lacteus]|uniref:Uncharacterized protein n=1 Tax=Mycetocola lacteus TaxID=76637 RepID=A0A3L7ATY2_9MICO|nr:hypothetical protein [Mycetocola lacteus]RLP83011.1 hypothetical protein D9V34_07140 [Mycetocola lacteus]